MVLQNDQLYAPTGLDPQGQDIASPFLFIQEALHYLIKIQSAGLYSSMKATIYLGKGNHSLFYCQGDEVYPSSISSTYINYCSLFGSSLLQEYSQFDNFTVTVKPLYCSLMTSLGYTSSNNYFKQACISDPASKPVIWVNHATAYFNISGSMTFENIKFTGVNAFANSLTEGEVSLELWPVQYCSVTTDPNGYDNALKLKANTTTDALFSFKCFDRWYQAPARPDMTQLDRRCKLNSYRKFNESQESGSACSPDPSDTGSDFFNH
jgi:hypothetical protein